MKAMSCEQVVERLPEWISGLLPEREIRWLEDHLGRCASCRGEAELVALVRSARPAPPEGLAARIAANLGDVVPDAAPTAGPRRAPGEARPRWAGGSAEGWPRWRLSWVLPAAAAVVLALVGPYLLGRGAGGNGGSEARVAAVDLTAEAWLWEDAVVAGAPSLDALSDEELATLLQEMGG